MRSVRYYIIILLMFAMQSVFPQVKRVGFPFVRYYSPSDYRAGAQIWKIEISQEGLAYFANTDGVVEFDGMHCKNYPLPGDIVVRSLNATADGI